MKTLKTYGIPEMYRGTAEKFSASDSMTGAFDILAGIMQGDMLAPYLLLLVFN